MKEPKKFRLVAQLKPYKDFIASPLAGYAYPYYKHTLTLESGGKVILACDIKAKTFGDDNHVVLIGRKEYKEYKNNKEIFCIPDEYQWYQLNKGSIIDKTGYIYESKKGITWQFTLEQLINFESLQISQEREKYRHYFPKFIQNSGVDENKDHFFSGLKPLVYDLKELRTPIKKGDSQASQFKRLVKERDETSIFFDSVPQGGGCFLCSWPQLNPKDFKETAEMETMYRIDQYLKSDVDREQTIHEVLEDLFIEKQRYFLHEGKVKSGRFDFVIESGKDSYTAIEVKVHDEVDAVKQLEDYISGLRTDPKFEGKYENAHIEGVILCGQSNQELEKKAKANGFKIWKYNLLFEVIDENGKHVLP